MMKDGCLELSPAQAQAKRNRLLACLPEQELNTLASYTKRVWLPTGAVLHSTGAFLNYLYFPESGVISVASSGDRAALHGLYGLEGLGCVSSVLRCPISPFTEVVQQSGFAQRIDLRDLYELFHRIPELDQLLVRYAHVFMMQLADGSASTGYRIEQRLARCLLMLQDRVMNGHLALTHQGLASLLGVRRAGVTDAIHLLEGRRLISAQRGMIKIIDRQRLQALTGGCYGRAEREYQRVIITQAAE